MFLDLMMPPGPDGLDTLRSLRERRIEVPVIMMSGKAQLADAVRATQLGAFQFLEKPLSPEAVLVTLRSAIELGRARTQNRALQEALGQRQEMVGSTPAITQVGSSSPRLRPPMPECSSLENRAPARSWSRPRSTGRVVDPAGHS
jgi:two-component system nitrogen regulation response regulator NtrX